MGTTKFLGILLCIGIFHSCTSYPSRESSSDEDFSQLQQQQNIDSDSLEEFTQKIQAKGRKPPKLQMPEEESKPDPHDPCLDSKKIGPCKARVPRYFFNQATGSCELFGWGGCGKSGNNFRELSDCETSCSKHLAKGKLNVRNKADEPNVVEICEKPAVNKGPQCEAYIPRWTYSTSEQNCVQFVWGGCAKTENNFATESLCQATCGDYPKLKGLSETDATTPPVSATTEAIDLGQQQNADNVESNEIACDLPSDSGICYAAFEKYYFNKVNNRCEIFLYGGCGGNKNRFDTAEDCVRACGGDRPTNDLQCSDVDCPWALYEHYVSLGCSPIYDGEACCPTRYECPDQQQGIQNNTLESRSLTLEKEEDESTTTAPDVTMPQKCRYRGKQYSVREMVDEASDTGSCRAGCICTDSDPEFGPRIVCAQIECPEHLGGRPQGKEDCIPLYKKGSCCAYDYYCPEGELTIIDPTQKQQTDDEPVLVKCEVDGEGYYEGQRVYPNKSPCSKCLCQRNPENVTSPVGQLFCEKVDCGIEIYYVHYLARGCAPVYYEKADGTTSCCPIFWECPKDKQQESSDNEDEATTPAGSSVPEPPKPPSTDTPSSLSPVPPSPPSSAEKPTSPLIRSREVCEMEKVEGTCKGHRPRFFFNKETSKCENFTYTGCAGNLNNFASLKDCQELCESPLPSSPVPPSYPGKGAKTTGGSDLLGRSRRIETVPRSLETKSISLTEVDPCTLPRRVGRCKGYFPRFYYSPEDNECKLFIFGGCRPNANNFYSKESCEATCLNSIPVENLRTSVPARLASNPALGRRFNPDGGDSSKVNFGEDRDAELRQLQPLVPESASTEEDSVCKLEPRTGRCKAFVRRFYYDSEKKICKSFTYGGCSGNANNFQTLEECDQKCMPSRNIELHQGPRRRLGWRIASPDGGNGGNWATTSDVASGNPSPGARNSLPPSASFTARCKLPKTAGSCHNSIRSYYYDAETKSCKLFFYSGCFGNANRFASREDCENLCNKPLEYEGTSTTNQTTNQPNRPQVHELGESESDSEDAEAIEVAKQKEFCNLDPVPGDCNAKQLRFYYDSVAEQCLPFVFSGCKGNKNNFVTEAECMSSCGNSPTVEQLADEMVLSCTFGNKTLPLGGTVGATNDDNEYSGDELPCGVPVCQCITPPSVTCVQRVCPEPTTTTTGPPKICATPTCLHFCTQTIGEDGCPTCDCDYNRSSLDEIVTKKVPTKSVKG